MPIPRRERFLIESEEQSYEQFLEKFDERHPPESEETEQMEEENLEAETEDEHAGDGE